MRKLSWKRPRVLILVCKFCSHKYRENNYDIFNWVLHEQGRWFCCIVSNRSYFSLTLVHANQWSACIFELIVFVICWVNHVRFNNLKKSTYMQIRLAVCSVIFIRKLAIMVSVCPDISVWIFHFKIPWFLQACSTKWENILFVIMTVTLILFSFTNQIQI